MEEEADIRSVFREDFRDGFRMDFLSFFLGKMAGRGGEEKKVEMGEGMWERGGGEEKLKSAYGKNKFCDHIVFLQKPVFGEM